MNTIIYVATRECCMHDDFYAAYTTLEAAQAYVDQLGEDRMSITPVEMDTGETFFREED